jgi:hypothetical protein
MANEAKSGRDAMVEEKEENPELIVSAAVNG